MRAHGARAAHAVIAALCALCALSPGSASARTPPLRQIATITPRFDFQTRFLAIDPSARRLFEIGQPTGGSGMGIVAYDLDSLRPVGRARIANAQSGYGGRLAAVDELRHRMYVVFPYRYADTAVARTDATGPILDETTRTHLAIAVIDTVRTRVLGVRVLPDLVAPPSDRSNSNFVGVKALAYHAPEDKLYLLSEDTSARAVEIMGADHAVLLHQIDAGALLDPGRASAIDWSYPVPQCPMVMARNVPSVVLRSAYQPAVFFACRGGDVLGKPVPGEVSGIVRVGIRAGTSAGDTSRFTTEFHPISGDTHDGIVAVDPVSERFLVGADLTSGEPRVWMFDTASSSWIGLVVAPTFWAIAVDRAHGRFYTLSPSFTERPPYRTRSVVAGTRGAADQGSVVDVLLRGAPDNTRVPVVDPLRHRIFWPGHDDYAVIEDTLPPTRAPRAHDPDDATVDVDESAATAANFLGGGRAYGARVRLVGGWRAAERNNQSVYPELVDTVRAFLESPRVPAAPAEGTRDLTLARVPHATVSNGEATASATAGDRDRSATERDLESWRTWLRAHRGPDPGGWPYALVECADFGGDPAERAARGASVSCARERSRVAADAETRDAVGPANASSVAVSIGATSSSVRSFRDDVRGVVTVVTAEARGIELGGRAGIGRVAARAETWATGRSVRSNGQGAGSRYTRVIEDVWVLHDGVRRTLCTSPCDPRAVVQAIGAALGARVRVELPQPDPLLARGTPGGYEALVVRRPAERENDRWLNEETDARLEVPAMVVTAFADGRVPSRTVLSFAAVSAESHYGIYLLARETGAAPRARVLPPAPDAPQPLDARPQRGGSTGIVETIRTVVDGVRLVLASPSQAIRVGAFFAFLAMPLVLIRRRGAQGRS